MLILSSILLPILLLDSQTGFSHPIRTVDSLAVFAADSLARLIPDLFVGFPCFMCLWDFLAGNTLPMPLLIPLLCLVHRC